MLKLTRNVIDSRLDFRLHVESWEAVQLLRATQFLVFSESLDSQRLTVLPSQSGLQRGEIKGPVLSWDLGTGEVQVPPYSMKPGCPGT